MSFSSMWIQCDVGLFSTYPASFSNRPSRSSRGSSSALRYACTVSVIDHGFTYNAPLRTRAAAVNSESTTAGASCCCAWTVMNSSGKAFMPSRMGVHASTDPTDQIAARCAADRNGTSWNTTTGAVLAKRWLMRATMSRTSTRDDS